MNPTANIWLRRWNIIIINDVQSEHAKESQKPPLRHMKTIVKPSYYRIFTFRIHNAHAVNKLYLYPWPRDNNLKFMERRVLC